MNGKDILAIGDLTRRQITAAAAHIVFPPVRVFIAETVTSMVPRLRALSCP